MKKIILTLTVAIVTISLTSCGDIIRKFFPQGEDRKEAVEQAEPSLSDKLAGESRWSGLLDGTYPFAIEIKVVGNSISGTYWPNATRSGAPSTIQGRVEGNSIAFDVLTGGTVTRSFIGNDISDGSVRGTFQSGYNGAVRHFEMHML